MKKLDILKKILQGAQLVPGPVGMVASGVDRLIQRDNDPTNDLEETVDAVCDVAEAAVKLGEDIKGKDFVDDAAFAALNERLRVDVGYYVRAVQTLKVKPAA